jgi:hypothetical protein
MPQAPSMNQEQQSQQNQQRDRYQEATIDITEHIGEKLLALMRTPENQARLQSLLDPIVNHIINRIFPYILLSAILFLIMLLLSVGTFWMVMRGAGGSEFLGRSVSPGD